MMHAYRRDGSPCYTYINDKGVEKDVGIVYVRKNGLFPGVSAILDLHEEDGLKTYKREQVISAALFHPYKDGTCPKKWKNEIRMISDAHRKQASDKGSQIHKALEDSFNGGFTFNIYDDLNIDIIYEAMKFIEITFGDVKWEAEKTFAIDFAGGFGGCIDLISTEGKGIIIDFKTKDVDDVKKFKIYKKHCYQLASYSEGSGFPKADCYNMYISSTSPGVIKLKKWSDMEIHKGFNAFYYLCKYYHIYNELNYEEIK